MSAKKNNILILCGPCGTGKTNVAMNIAINLKRKGKDVTFIDLDLINPYFKSSNYCKSLKDADIKIIPPSFSGSNLDIPVIPPDIYSIFNKPDKNFVIDVGGNDVGARVLGRFAKELEKNGYDMFFVINKHCASSNNLDELARMIFRIQRASRLNISGIINNSNLAKSTKASDIIDSIPFAEELSNKISLPVIMTTALTSFIPSLRSNIENLYPIDIHIGLWNNDDLY